MQLAESMGFDSCSFMGKHRTKSKKVSIDTHCPHAVSPGQHSPIRRIASMASRKRARSNPEEPETIDETIDRIRRNDETLTRAVFNKISLLQFGRIFTYLETNTFLRELNVSDIGLGDGHIQMIQPALLANKTMKCLKLANNKFSLRGILQIIEIVGTKGILIDLDFSNQNTESRQRERSELENRIVHMVERNDTLESLGLELWNKDLQHRLNAKLASNRRRREEAVPVSTA